MTSYALRMSELDNLRSRRRSLVCQIDQLGQELREIGAGLHHDETPHDLLITAQEVRAKALELIELAEKLRVLDSMMEDFA